MTIDKKQTPSRKQREFEKQIRHAQNYGMGAGMLSNALSNLQQANYAHAENKISVLLFQLRNKWDVSLTARELCLKFFLRMLTIKHFKEIYYRGKNTEDKPFIIYDGKQWTVVLEQVKAVDLLQSEYIGLSFRILPDDSRYVIAKIWKARKHHG